MFNFYMFVYAMKDNIGLLITNGDTNADDHDDDNDSGLDIDDKLTQTFS